MLSRYDILIKKPIVSSVPKEELIPSKEIRQFVYGARRSGKTTWLINQILEYEALRPYRALNTVLILVRNQASRHYFLSMLPASTQSLVQTETVNSIHLDPSVSFRGRDFSSYAFVCMDDFDEFPVFFQEDVPNIFCNVPIIATGTHRCLTYFWTDCREIRDHLVYQEGMENESLGSSFNPF